jgi:hypothetical protein
MKKGKRWGKWKKNKRQKYGQTQVFFPFVFYHWRVPPLTQGNGWGSTSPWYAT